MRAETERRAAGELAGTRAAWRIWGSGPRKAVALHCSLAHAGAWEGLALRLAYALEIRAFDLPGHGGSGPTSGDLLDQTAAMALALIGEERVDLLGHSFGAVACLQVALLRPDLVRSLALYEPVFFAAAAGFDLAPLRAFEVPLATGDADEAARQFHALWGMGLRWEDLPPRQRAAMAEQMPVIPAASAALYHDRAGLLAPGRLESLTAPVLLMAGTASPPVTAAINAGLAARLPVARRVVLPGAGHMGPLTHPHAVAAEIRAHLGL